jgi:hypothetical protein
MVPRLSPADEALVPRRARPRRRPLRRRSLDIALGVLVCGIFCLKLDNYVDPGSLRWSAISTAVTTAVANAVSAISNLPVLNSCPPALRMADISGGFVCTPPHASGRFAQIYATYPLVGRGRETIYTSTDSGSVSAANALLHNVFDVTRYQPVRLPAIPTWTENPYGARYWRFEFYSLRPSLNLLYAFRTTGSQAYARRLVQLDLSFIKAEPHSPWAWDDPHAVAFRTMYLVDTWWKLRQHHALSEQASAAMLGELEKSGLFLADPNNYQIGENHGTNEAVALFNLAVAFPTLPHAQQWKTLAEDRFDWQLKGVIDADGQLIENSPFYDFYTLEKYWETYLYMQAQHQVIPPEFAPRLRDMLNFASYILQPNSQVPLLGASVQETINDFGLYAGMAKTSPTLLYVLTHGAQGSRPPADSKYFPASSLSVMRSGWPSGAAFSKSTYLTYYTGRYRTDHSDLDALDLTLYGDGGLLLTDPGLYTYTSPGPYRPYFHGTASHDDVTVDGQAQSQGNGIAGPLVSKDGITYQSGESSLYSGVQHRRLVMMLGADHVLVVDQLHSKSAHTYRQMWHLFPGARLQTAGLTVSGVGGTPGRRITIQQLAPAGITRTSVINQRGHHPAGLCSVTYGHLEPCWQTAYAAHGHDATFVTLLTIGRPQQKGFAVRLASASQLQVTLGGRHLKVALGHTAVVLPQARATDPAPPAATPVTVAAAADPADWSRSGSGTLTAPSASSSRGRRAQPVATLSVSPAASGSAALANDAVRLNLLSGDASLRLEVTGLTRVSGLRLSLSNDHWANSVTADLSDAQLAAAGGQWAGFPVSPASDPAAHGSWRPAAPGFSWSKVDGIRITVVARAGAGPGPAVSVGGLTWQPAQNQGRLVFVFGNGYQSILPAAAYLHRSGMPGNISVVGKDVDWPTEGYLNLYQLKTLQNAWGWDMVNNTQDDLNAVQKYASQKDLTGFSNDILEQASWLESNGLNSAPNWFMYPHGATSPALEKVVARYYMFAAGAPGTSDAYPFGDREQVSTLVVQNAFTGDGGGPGATSPQEVIADARAAQANHTTLIVTFQRIHATPTDVPGYPLRMFEEIVNGVRSTGIPVMTLSQLDRSYGVPVTNHISWAAGRPALISAQISA